MRTNIDIDDALMAEAMRLMELPTKKAVVEESLRRAIQMERRKGILKLAGKVTWIGDLDESREGRNVR